MSTFREIHLGREAIQFIRDCLEEGGMTLGRGLLLHCDLEKGRVLTYLPTTVSEDETRQFKFGGKVEEIPLGPADNFVAEAGTRWVRVPTEDTDNHLVRTIQAYLRGEGGRWCIFEDAVSSPSFPYIRRRRDGRIRVLGSEVYYLIGKSDAEDEARILKTVRNAQSGWRFACAMSSVPERVHFLEGGRSLKRDEVRVLAERAEKIAVGAYDGEGYLIWSKGEVP